LRVIREPKEKKRFVGEWWRYTHNFSCLFHIPRYYKAKIREGKSYGSQTCIEMCQCTQCKTVAEVSRKRSLWLENEATMRFHGRIF